MGKTYTFIGTLENLESIFRSDDGELSVEKDHSYLVEATPEETTEAYGLFPHLRPLHVKTQPSGVAGFILAVKETLGS